ncbi:unnamed protein product [Amoebophrya sp. A120]|nr:unnamed protein product [Amoebophrya sp. A120]|eukprot:GSA120T00016705001.1
MLTMMNSSTKNLLLLEGRVGSHSTKNARGRLLLALIWLFIQHCFHDVDAVLVQQLQEEMEKEDEAEFNKVLVQAKREEEKHDHPTLGDDDSAPVTAVLGSMDAAEYQEAKGVVAPLQATAEHVEQALEVVVGASSGGGLAAKNKTSNDPERSNVAKNKISADQEHRVEQAALTNKEQQDEEGEVAASNVQAAQEMRARGESQSHNGGVFVIGDGEQVIEASNPYFIPHNQAPLHTWVTWRWTTASKEYEDEKCAVLEMAAAVAALQKNGTAREEIRARMVSGKEKLLDPNNPCYKKLVGEDWTQDVLVALPLPCQEFQQITQEVVTKRSQVSEAKADKRIRETAQMRREHKLCNELGHLRPGEAEKDSRIVEKQKEHLYYQLPRTMLSFSGIQLKGCRVVAGHLWSEFYPGQGRGIEKVLWCYTMDTNLEILLRLMNVEGGTSLIDGQHKENFFRTYLEFSSLQNVPQRPPPHSLYKALVPDSQKAAIEGRQQVRRAGAGAKKTKNKGLLGLRRRSKNAPEDAKLKSEQVEVSEVRSEHEEPQSSQVVARGPLASTSNKGAIALEDVGPARATSSTSSASSIVDVVEDYYAKAEEIMVSDSAQNSTADGRSSATAQMSPDVDTAVTSLEPATAKKMPTSSATTSSFLSSTRRLSLLQRTKMLGDEGEGNANEPELGFLGRMRARLKKAKTAVVDKVAKPVAKRARSGVSRIMRKINPVLKPLGEKAQDILLGTEGKEENVDKEMIAAPQKFVPRVEVVAELCKQEGRNLMISWLKLPLEIAIPFLITWKLGALDKLFHNTLMPFIHEHSPWVETLVASGVNVARGMTSYAHGTVYETASRYRLPFAKWTGYSDPKVVLDMVKHEGLSQVSTMVGVDLKSDDALDDSLVASKLTKSYLTDHSNANSLVGGQLKTAKGWAEGKVRVIADQQPKQLIMGMGHQTIFKERQNQRTGQLGAATEEKRTSAQILSDRADLDKKMLHNLVKTTARVEDATAKSFLLKNIKSPNAMNIQSAVPPDEELLQQEASIPAAASDEEDVEGAKKKASRPGAPPPSSPASLSGAARVQNQNPTPARTTADEKVAENKGKAAAQVDEVHDVETSVTSFLAFVHAQFLERASQHVWYQAGTSSTLGTNSTALGASSWLEKIGATATTSQADEDQDLILEVNVNAVDLNRALALVEEPDLDPILPSFLDVEEHFELVEHHEEHEQEDSGSKTPKAATTSAGGVTNAKKKTKKKLVTVKREKKFLERVKEQFWQTGPVAALRQYRRQFRVAFDATLKGCVKSHFNLKEQAKLQQAYKEAALNETKKFFDDHAAKEQDVQHAAKEQDVQLHAAKEQDGAREEVAPDLLNTTSEGKERVDQMQ